MPRKNYKQLMLLVVLGCMWAALGAASAAPPDRLTITVIGTNDLHGAILQSHAAGGLQIFSGYLKNIRATRAADGGAVLLIDAGDMWQGTLESNLAEGAPVVQAYNRLGYAAAAIGNHEFDYGPEGPQVSPERVTDDPRGALKARATEAQFPFLAANLIDNDTGLPVAWANVSPSIMREIAGITVGITGVITEQALATTNVANIGGLRIAPLAASIRRQAAALRRNGAGIVIVAAHAGSMCTEFGDPDDLSSCDLDGEIMRVAKALPAGLVDIIIGGHVHQGIAHKVNGIAIISSYSSGIAFGRVDIDIDRKHAQIIDKKVYPPEYICEFQESGTSGCSTGTTGAPRAVYAGSTVIPDQGLMAAIRPSIIDALRYKGRKLGAEAEAGFSKPRKPESPLGNLLTDIMLKETIGADVAIHNTVGGVRAGLPSGRITFGNIYEIYPFDNKIVRLTLNGANLRKLFALQFQTGHWAAGVAGLHIVAECRGPRLRVSMTRDDGSTVKDEDQLSVVTTDFLAGGGDNVFSPIMPPGGFPLTVSLHGFREIIVGWFTHHEGTIRVSDFYNPQSPRFVLPGKLPVSCN